MKHKQPQIYVDTVDKSTERCYYIFNSFLELLFRNPSCFFFIFWFSILLFLYNLFIYFYTIHSYNWLEAKNCKLLDIVSCWNFHVVRTHLFMKTCQIQDSSFQTTLSYTLLSCIRKMTRSITGIHDFNRKFRRNRNLSTYKTR